MASDLDDLMSADPLGLSRQDLDKIITHMRQQRAKYGDGTVKAKKEAGPKKSLTLADLGLAVKVEQPTVKRRI